MNPNSLSKLIFFLSSLVSFNLFASQSVLDFTAIGSEIKVLMHQYHYNPEELSSIAYKEMEEKVEALATAASDKQAFIEGFNRIWYEGPFSHVRIDNARMPASQMADYLDTMNVGGNGAALSWNGTIAILKVDTMMGIDTIE